MCIRDSRRCPGSHNNFGDCLCLARADLVKEVALAGLELWKLHSQDQLVRLKHGASVAFVELIQRHPAGPSYAAYFNLGVGGDEHRQTVAGRRGVDYVAAY